jgi:hypothetical protein
MNNLPISKQIKFALYHFSNVIFYIYSTLNILWASLAIISLPFQTTGYEGYAILPFFLMSIVLSPVALICPIIFFSIHNDPDLKSNRNPKKFAIVAVISGFITLLVVSVLFG